MLIREHDILTVTSVHTKTVLYKHLTQLIHHLLVMMQTMFMWQIKAPLFDVI